MNYLCFLFFFFSLIRLVFPFLFFFCEVVILQYPAIFLFKTIKKLLSFFVQFSFYLILSTLLDFQCEFVKWTETEKVFLYQLILLFNVLTACCLLILKKFSKINVCVAIFFSLFCFQTVCPLFHSTFFKNFKMTNKTCKRYTPKRQNGKQVNFS